MVNPEKQGSFPWTKNRQKYTNYTFGICEKTPFCELFLEFSHVSKRGHALKCINMPQLFDLQKKDTKNEFSRHKKLLLCKKPWGRSEKTQKQHGATGTLQTGPGRDVDDQCCGWFWVGSCVVWRAKTNNFPMWAAWLYSTGTGNFHFEMVVSEGWPQVITWKCKFQQTLIKQIGV